jgi:AcrR family transcriptional regulator
MGVAAITQTGDRVDGQRLDQKREATRDVILEAAHRVLGQVGYERITTRRIAEEAGVNIATLHYYFGSKEQLLSETVRYALSRNQVQLRAAIEEAPDAPTALAQAFQTVWQIARERRGILRYDLVIRALRDEDARTEAQKVYTAYRGMVEAIVERHIATGGTLTEGVTPAQFAGCIVSAVDGVVLQHAVMHDDDTARNSLAMILQYALTLMGVSDAQTARI